MFTYLLLLYRNKIDFCIFILCPANLLFFVIKSRNYLCRFHRIFYKYHHVIFIWKVLFLHFWPLHLFISFTCCSHFFFFDFSFQMFVIRCGIDFLKILYNLEFSQLLESVGLWFLPNLENWKFFQPYTLSLLLMHYDHTTIMSFF